MNSLEARSSKWGYGLVSLGIKSLIKLERGPVALKEKKPKRRPLKGPIEYRFIDGGSAKNVIFLHGLGQRFDTLEHLYADTRLRSWANVWSLTLPNHGKSYYDAKASVERLADAVVSFIFVHKIKSIYLAGFGLGGRVAMHVAARHPDLIEALCIVNMVPYGLAPSQILPQIKFLETTLSFSLAGKSYAEIKAHLTKTFNERAARLMLQWLEGEEFRYSWTVKAKPLVKALEGLVDQPIERLPFYKPVRFIFGRQSSYYMADRLIELYNYYPNLEIDADVLCLDADSQLAFTHREDVLKIIEGLLKGDKN